MFRMVRFPRVPPLETFVSLYTPRATASSDSLSPCAAARSFRKFMRPPCECFEWLALFVCRRSKLSVKEGIPVRMFRVVRSPRVLPFEAFERLYTPRVNVSSGSLSLCAAARSFRNCIIPACECFECFGFPVCRRS